MQTSIPRKKQKAVPLSARTLDKLLPYTVAASAALAGVAPSAQAAVVYTPANAVITDGYSLTIEGTQALTFKLSAGVFSEFLSVLTPNGGVVPQDGYAARLNSNVLIDRFEKLNTGKTRIDRAVPLSDSSTAEGYGPWGGAYGSVATGYIGFEYGVKGEKHFGWARLSVTQSWSVDSPLTITATLTGYAYETLPYRGIKAGEESGRVAHVTAGPLAPKPTLGLLAFGAEAPPLWRKD